MPAISQERRVGRGREAGWMGWGEQGALPAPIWADVAQRWNSRAERCYCAGRKSKDLGTEPGPVEEKGPGTRRCSGREVKP